jgi:hypothetical protein
MDLISGMSVQISFGAHATYWKGNRQEASVASVRWHCEGGFIPVSVCMRGVSLIKYTHQKYYN